MLFKSLECLRDIEKLINETHDLPIFRGYKAINKRGVEKLIDEIYASLPEDVLNARIYLREHNYEIRKKVKEKTNVYDLLKMFEIALEDGYQFMQSVVIKTKEIENLLDRIYENMPDEIDEVQKNNKL
ncbi:hypothetical protein IJ579_06605 [bacterium]|nr:hypothetical protein [bacterium]